MRFALFLLSCCIAASWQQQNQYYWSPYYSHGLGPLPPYHPGQYYKGQHPYNPSAHHFAEYFNPSLYPSFNQQVHQKSDQESEADQAVQALYARLLLSQQLAALKNQQDDSRVDIDQGEEDTVARVAAGLFRKKPTNEAEDVVEDRAFGFPKFIIRNQIFRTSTKYSVTTTTVTSISAVSCIAAASFYGGSSQACRKRRDVVLSLLEDADEPLVQPTAVQSIETTSTVESHVVPRSASLDSSLHFEERQNVNNILPNTGLYGFTVTSTLTSYSIVTSLSKKTVKLGSNISCLPNGFRVC